MSLSTRRSNTYITLTGIVIVFVAISTFVLHTVQYCKTNCQLHQLGAIHYRVFRPLYLGHSSMVGSQWGPGDPQYYVWSKSCLDHLRENESLFQIYSHIPGLWWLQDPTLLCSSRSSLALSNKLNSCLFLRDLSTLLPFPLKGVC